MIRDPRYIVPCCGVISKWTVYVMKSGTIHFQAWRDLGTGSYRFMGENLATYHPGEEVNYYTTLVDKENEIPVKDGDYIGWYNSDKSMAGYATERRGFGALSASLRNRYKVGDEVDWSNGKVSGPRSYGLAATVKKGAQPKFKNLDAEIEISDDLISGTSVYSLSFEGYNTGFIPYNYQVEMDTITDYFYYNSTSNVIYLKKQPPVGKFILDFIVMDHCDTSGKGKLRINIKSRTPHIRNLPWSAFVREDIHRQELLLHEINVTYRENVICTLQKVEPPKTASFFTIKAIANKTFVYGVYLKSNADLNYDKTDLYVLAVKCSEGKTFDMQDLHVYVEANKAPRFINVPGSFHIDAKTAKIAEPLYQVKTSDEENNVIRHKLVCDNVHPCPFNITKDGAVFLQQSLNRSIAKIVFLNVTIEDDFNVVGPSILIANITNFNRPPYIQDMTDVTITLHENSPAGIILFKVGARDPDDDDVISFSLTVRPSKMRQYFAINESTGVITAVSPVDFEAVKFRVSKLIVSVSDGKDEASSFLKVALVDENEPPEFLFGSFIMHIKEGNPSPKNDLKIKAKDSDKSGAVTYSMTCENDTDAFQVNENTGAVSQVEVVDIDHLNVSEYVIECNITAVDVGGLTTFAPLTIIIEDVNDNSPIFSKTSYLFVVADYVPVYSDIGNVRAIDIDTTPENSQIFYKINDEYDDFIIDENGTIFMMKDVATIPFGSVFRYNVTAEDKDLLFDSVPVTIVVIANLDPALLQYGNRFLSFPENIVWTISAAYVSFIALGLILFLPTYYLRCSIKKRRQVGDSRVQRPISVNSTLSTRTYTNLFEKTTSREDIVLSPESHLRCASFTDTSLSKNRTNSSVSKKGTTANQPKENMDKIVASKSTGNDMSAVSPVSEPHFESFTGTSSSKNRTVAKKHIPSNDKVFAGEKNDQPHSTSPVRYANLTGTSSPKNRTISSVLRTNTLASKPKENIDETVTSENSVCVMSPVPQLRCASYTDTSTTKHSISSGLKKGIRESQNKENPDEGVPAETNGATDNKNTNLTVTDLPARVFSSIPRVVSVERNSVDSKLSFSVSSSSKLNSVSKCSLSDINPSESIPWKPWSVHDFLSF